MADHLIRSSSLQPSPFLIFPCSLHRRWRFSGGIRFSVPELRLSSSQLQLANSTSSSSSEKFDLVSTTQLEDGSHVFRFGDASEIERNLEIEAKVKKQHGKISGKVSDVSKKQGIKQEPEVKSEEEERVATANISNVIKIKDRKRVRSSAKKKKESLNSSGNVSRSEDEVASVSNLSSVGSTVVEAVPSSSIEEIDEKPEPIIENEAVVESGKVEADTASSVVTVAEDVPSSFTEENGVVSEKSEPIIEHEAVVKSENVEAEIASSIVSVAEAIPSSTTEEKAVVSEEPEPIIEHEVTVESDKVEAKVASVSNLNSVVSVAEAVPNSTTEEKVVSENPEPNIENKVLVESNDVQPLSSEVTEEVAVNEIRDNEPNGYQGINENRLEVQESPRSSTSQNGSQSEALKEVHVPVSTIELDDNLDVRETIEAEKKLVVEPTATAAVSPDEITSTSDETHDSFDENPAMPVIDTSEANDEENVASTIEDKLTARDTEAADDGSLSKTVNDTKVDDLQLPAPEMTDLESSEVTSGREEVVSKAFFLDSGLASLQTPSKALAGREDAYFVSNHNWLGIADGVSEWSFEGINKGRYAQELMSNCQKTVSDESAKITDPVQVLHRSVNETKSTGSSTALIAHLDNNELHVANIGDSGFMVIRNGTVLQRSSPMFHHFWYPMHITQGDDVLKLAEVYHVNLDEGDVIITASDGLYDNLYEKEIVSIVSRSLEQNLEPQKIAELVAAKAQEVGLSGTEKTPFADAAKEQGYDGYKGGKLDAVTVIVSLVKTVTM